MDTLINAVILECECVETFLLNKYGIENTEKSNKSKNKKSIILPFCGYKRGGCEALCFNYGLYTQCEKPISEGLLCITCNKMVEKKGRTQYGMIDDRIKAGDAFQDPKGKKIIPYGNVLDKLGISKEDAIIACREAGREMNDADFDIVKATRGRPKKEKEVKEARPRGRPKKEKDVITNMGDELISKLFESKDTKTKETENKDVKEYDNKDNNDINNDEDRDESDDSGDEVNVIEFEYEGKTYYRDDDGVVYKNMEGDEVGEWDDEMQTIKFTQ